MRTHTHPHLTFQEHLTSCSCVCVPATPPSVLFLPPAGGWLAQERGIINFLEWQTLDVQRAVLSHPLLRVPQPPSLLPVIHCLYIFFYFFPKQTSHDFTHRCSWCVNVIVVSLIVVVHVNGLYFLSESMCGSRYLVLVLLVFVLSVAVKLHLVCPYHTM